MSRHRAIPISRPFAVALAVVGFCYGAGLKVYPSPAVADVRLADEPSASKAEQPAAATLAQEAAAAYVLRTIWREPPTFTREGELFDPEKVPLEPIDVALDAAGRLVVADAGGRQVRVYGADPAAPDGLLALASWAPPVIEGARHAGVPIVPHRLAADRERGRVHVLWRALIGNLKPPEGQEGDQWLVSYAADGTALGPPRAWPGVGSGADLDITVDPANGEVVGFRESGCRLLRWPDEGVPREFPATLEAGCAGPRLAMGTDGRMSLLARTTWGLRVLQLSADGRERGALSLAREWPLDVAGGLDEDGGVHVLADSPPGAPDLALLLRFDAQREPLATLALQGPGDPRFEERGWPHALDVAGSRVAFTSFEDGPNVRIYDPSTGEARVLRGATGLTRPTYGVPPRSGGRPRPNIMLAGQSDGGVVVLDHRLEAFYRRAVGSSPVRIDALTEGAVDFGLTGDGRPIVVDADHIARLDDAGWRIGCPCGADPRVAVGPRAIFVAPDGPSPVEARALDDGQRIVYLSGLGAGAGYPADIAVSGGGWLLTANYERRAIDGWMLNEASLPSSDRPDRSWETGSVGGAVRLAATETVDGPRVVALVGARRGLAAEVFDVATGIRVARLPLWSVMDAVEVPVDVALDGAGRLYVSGESGAIYVFEPAAAGSPSPTPVSTGPVPTPDPAASCRPSGRTGVSPARILLGATTTVSLSLRMDCPRKPVGHGSDIVLVVDSSGSMEGEKLAAALAAAREFLGLVDLGLHRVAVVDFDSDARVVAPLGIDAQAAISATGVISAGGGTNIWGALRTAATHVAAAGRDRAQPVVVLLSDGQSGLVEAIERQGKQMRAQGFVIYTVGLGEDADHQLLERLAGDPRRYHFAPGPSDLRRIYEAIRLEVEEGAQPLALVDEVLAADLRLIHGSAVPAALEGKHSLRWQVPLAAPAATVFEATFDLRPERAGLLPVHERLEVAYTDIDGIERKHALPQAFVEVVGPTATASPLPSDTPPPTLTPEPTPTATPTRAVTPSPSATPTPSRTPLPTSSPVPTATIEPQTPSPSPTVRASPTRVRLHLPLALREPPCGRKRQAVNVALVIDASGSMAEPVPGGGAKIDAAVAAVRRFLGHLRLDQGDQAALIAFNERASVLESLTADGLRLQLALLRPRLAPGTRIDRALAAGRIELLRGGRRPGNARVLLLLTDGRSSEPPAEALRLAGLARRDGIAIHAIGLGQEVDAAHLAEIAGDPERLHLAPSAADLAAIYERVAKEIPCPREGYWGRR